MEPSAVFFDGGDNSLSSNEKIACCVTLAGWIHADQPNHNAPGTYWKSHPDYTEDYHYDMDLDNDFIRRNYATVTDFPLAGTTIPGLCYGIFCSSQPIGLLYGPPDADTFIMPGEGDMTVELNSWHIPDRGQPPARWIHPDPSFTSNTNDAWPFDPNKPFGILQGDPGLTGGEYVIVSGYLIEDWAHISSAPSPSSSDYPAYSTRKCWNSMYSGQGGWLEIHPVDSVRVVRNNPGEVGPPLVRKNAVEVQACSDGIYGYPKTDALLTPWPTPSPVPSSGNPAQSFNMNYEEDIDPRFTDMATVTQHSVQACNGPNGPALHVAVAVGTPGHYKATYLLWWEIVEGNQTPTPLPPCAQPTPQPSPKACRCPPGSRLCESYPVCRCVPDKYPCP